MSLEEIERLPILDKEIAIKHLDDAGLFETMLMGFEEMSMRNNLTNLKIALEKMDYYNIRLSSHSLKGASSYLHAERVKTAASLIQFAVDKQRPDDIFKYYPILIKQCILLKRRVRYEECLKESKPFRDDESDFDVPLAKYFKIIKRSSNDFDIMQISKPGQFPPVPKYDFKPPNKMDSLVSSAMPGETKDQATAAQPQNDPEQNAGAGSNNTNSVANGTSDAVSHNAATTSSKQTATKDTEKKVKEMEAEVEQPGKEKKGAIKMDEAPKSTGCSCAIL